MLFLGTAALASGQTDLDRLRGDDLKRRIDLDSQIGLEGVEVIVGAKDASAFDDAIPGRRLDLRVIIRSGAPVALALDRVASPSSEANPPFPIVPADLIRLRSDNVKAEGLYSRVYDVRIAVDKSAPPRFSTLQFAFRRERVPGIATSGLLSPERQAACTISIPVGAEPQAKADDPTFLTVVPPAQIKVDAFGQPSKIKFTLKNGSDYEIRILGYSLGNDAHLFRRPEFAYPSKEQPEIRHDARTTYDLEVDPDDWSTLFAFNRTPTLDLRLRFSDGFREQELIVPALPFQVNYAWNITLVFCSLGAVLGGVLRTALSASWRSLSGPGKTLDLLKATGWSLLAGVLAWVISGSFNVQFMTGNIALLTATTAPGSFFIGMAAGLVPANEYLDRLRIWLLGNRAAQNAPGGAG